MKLTSIIIPTYNALELVKRTVEAVRQHTDETETPYELIVVDNGSTDGTDEWCAGERVHLLSLPRNTGFPAACNVGLRYARGDGLLLLNNDVTVMPGWLSGLTAALTGIPDAGIAGPVTNYCSGRQQIDVSFADMADFQRIAAERRGRPDLAPVQVQRLIGFCMLFKRELYERIGDLDERFSPGHYEDDDYCLRARMSGFGLLMCPDVLVHHEGSVSFKRSDPGQLQRLVKTNRRRFIEKWRIDPSTFM
ncbi:glycosyltransferase family 2 protein [Paenibacillus humicola]|uniref:glycosyltransferase family 2 protein n=1 Tax=Paenibacillus humicola TaxID=3110540 RepID=UPI00237C0015|nr:glycosyltransferase family 2 protein [Paenibacillus humicola]